MKSRKDLEEALKLNGFALKRENKHLVYSNGRQTLVTSRTPSCTRVHEKNYSMLRRIITQAGGEFVELENKGRKTKADRPEGASVMSGQFNTPRTIVKPGPGSLPVPREVTNGATAPASTAKPATVKQLDTDALILAKQGFDQGKTQKWITEALTQLGYRSPGGLVLHQTDISRWMRSQGMRYHAKKNYGAKKIANPGTTKAKTVSTPSAVIAAPQKRAATSGRERLVEQVTDLLSSNISDDTKAELIIILVRNHAD